MNQTSELNKLKNTYLPIASNLIPLSIEDKEFITHIGADYIIKDGDDRYQIYMTESEGVKTLEIDKNHVQLVGEEFEKVRDSLGLKNFNDIVKESDISLKNCASYKSLKGLEDAMSKGKKIIAVPLLENGIQSEPLITYSSGVTEATEIAKHYIKSWNISNTIIGKPVYLSEKEIEQHIEAKKTNVKNEYIRFLDEFTKKYAQEYVNKPELKVDIPTSFETEKENNKKISTNFVLDKLKTAGIEVITDKAEFDRILEGEEVLQKMQGDIERLRELAKQKNILENQKESVVKDKKDLIEQSFQDVVNLITQIAFAIPFGNSYWGYENAIVLPGGKFALGRTKQTPTVCTLMYQDPKPCYYPLCSLPAAKKELEDASFKQDGHGYFYLKEFKNYCYSTNLAEKLPSIISNYLEVYNQKLSIENNSILQKNTELKKYFEQSKLQEETNKTVLHDSKKLLVEILTDIATPLTEIEYSSDNYIKIFGNGIIQSPLETIKLGKNQFVRLCPPNRNNLMGAIYDTITKPSLILEKETLDSVTEDFKPVHIYGKSFINKNNNHIRTVESIIIFKDDENIVISSHNKGLEDFVKQIKTTDEVLYLDNTLISRLTTFIENNGGSHVVKEVTKLLSSAGQIESLPLNKEYNETKLLSIKDMCKQGILHEGNLEITKDNFIKYYNIFNQNTKIYKDNPNKIVSDLFNYHVNADNKEEMRAWLSNQGYSINEKNITELMVQGATTYGFTHNGKIYLDPEIMNSNVAVHEYTHLWDKFTQNTNPDLWEKGKTVFSKTHLWEDVKNDPNYADIAYDDDLVLSECHARICGEIAEKVLERIAERDGEIAKNAVIDWDKEVSIYISESLTKDNKEKLFDNDFSIEDAKQFLSQPMKDLISEKNISLKLEPKVTIPQKYVSLVRNLVSKTGDNTMKQILVAGQKALMKFNTEEKSVIRDYLTSVGGVDSQSVGKFLSKIINKKNIETSKHYKNQKNKSEGICR